MSKQEFLSKAVVFMTWWVLLAIPAMLAVWVLTRRAIKQERLPPDTDILEVLLDVFITWPKVYYVSVLGFLSKISRRLLDSAVPPVDNEPTQKVDISEQFLSFVERRLYENPELHKWMLLSMDSQDNNGDTNFSVGKDAGTTYLVLMHNPDIWMQTYGSLKPQHNITKDRLEALHPWMVFDIVTKHPQLRQVLPAYVLSKLDVEVH